MSGRVDPRIAALRRFAISITAFNILGFLFLGFEQAYLTPIVGVATAYAVSLFLETVDAWARHGVARYRGSFTNLGVIVFRYATTSRMSASESSVAHPGIALPYRPWRTDWIRSSSVGTLLVSVDRILYLPLVKSRGRGVRNGDAGPSPLPVFPWHSTQ